MHLGKSASIAGLITFGTTTSLFAKIGEHGTSLSGRVRRVVPASKHVLPSRSLRAPVRWSEWRDQVLPQTMGDDHRHVFRCAAIFPLQTSDPDADPPAAQGMSMCLPLAFSQEAAKRKAAADAAEQEPLLPGHVRPLPMRCHGMRGFSRSLLSL